MTHHYHQDTKVLNGPTLKSKTDKTLTHRRDFYLYGHRAGKFRSLDDFLPHLLWLAFDTTELSVNCACILCSGKDLTDHLKQQGVDINNSNRARQTLTNIHFARARKENGQGKDYSRVAVPPI